MFEEGVDHCSLFRSSPLIVLSLVEGSNDAASDNSYKPHQAPPVEQHVLRLATAGARRNIVEEMHHFYIRSYDLPLEGPYGRMHFPQGICLILT